VETDTEGDAVGTWLGTAVLLGTDKKEAGTSGVPVGACDVDCFGTPVIDGMGAVFCASLGNVIGIRSEAVVIAVVGEEGTGPGDELARV
jgi:hypothetical protein